MSPKLKRLSGREVVTILRRLGFSVAKQRGSHVKMVRISSHGAREVLTVPAHDELDPGTLQAIFRQAARFISKEDLHSYFYSE